MSDGDYIKLNRKILEWEWYSNINTKSLFFHCLLKANWKDGKFEGVEIKRGSFVTSYPQLAAETNLSVKQVRVALNHLKRTGEVAVKGHAKFSVITVNNYNAYQDKGTIEGSQGAVKGQSKGSQGATIEEGKKERRKEGKNNIYTPDFEIVWNLYPRKVDKQKAFKSYEARRKEGFSADELMRAVKRYSSQCGTEERFIKHGATFFGPVTKTGEDYPFTDFLRPAPGEPVRCVEELEGWR
ncbi:hypothetical protein M2149_000812 [Lachnospiraceae bacterium PFB1-21]